MFLTLTSAGSLSGRHLSEQTPLLAEPESEVSSRGGVGRRLLNGVRATVMGLVAVGALTVLGGLAISGLLPVVLIAAALLLPALAPLLLLVIGLLAHEG